MDRIWEKCLFSVLFTTFFFFSNPRIKVPKNISEIELCLAKISTSKNTPTLR